MNWYKKYYLDMDGEAVPCDGWFCDIKRKDHKLSFNHSYRAEIHKDKTYNLNIWLCIGNKYIQHILTADTNRLEFKTLKEAKQWCQEQIHNFDKSPCPNSLIRDWKYKNCKPVFNMDLNYVGDSYFGPTYIYNPNTLEWDRTEYDYFNDNPVNYEKGTYHVLELCRPEDKLELRICNEMISPVCIGGEWIHDINLEEILLHKTFELDNPYLKRFKEFALTKVN